MPSLENKRALVTGGARGLGAAICRELARGGATMLVADRNLEGARAVAAEIERSGGKASALALDVGDERAAAAAVQAAGRIDVLINNAAIDHTVPIDELTLEEWDAVIRVN